MSETGKKGEERANAARKSIREEIAIAFPVALAVGGVLVYGLLILAYSEFYSELGVRPSEVGLQYGPGVGGIAGVAIVLVLVILVSLLLLAVISLVISRRFPKLARWLADQNEGRTRLRSPIVVLTVSLVVFLVCVGFALGFARAANTRADHIKEGLPVEPVRWAGIEILSVRADLAKVKPIDLNAHPSSAVEQLRGRDKLFYLGRNAGTLVLYDANTQSSWHVPASTLAVRVANCETRRAKDPACPD